jgi:hypothetical protein
MDEKEDSIWDRVSREQQVMKRLAQNVSQIWHSISTLPQDELLRLFEALTYAGEGFDDDLHYRKKILENIRDEFLVALINVRMPVSLAGQIEKRLRLSEGEPPESDSSELTIDC